MLENIDAPKDSFEEFLEDEKNKRRYSSQHRDFEEVVKNISKALRQKYIHIEWNETAKIWDELIHLLLKVY